MSRFASVDEQFTYLNKGAAEIIPESDLRAKLEKSRATGIPLRVKLGMDPTAPDLHLGHTVVLRKLKQIEFAGPIGFQGYAIKGDARSILTPTMNAWRKLTARE